MSDQPEGTKTSIIEPLPSGWLSWQATRLEDEIRDHNRRYWDEASPTVSDYDYDRLVEQLKRLDPSSSLLNELGPSSAGEVGDEVVHNTAMLSLEKCYDEEHLLKWADKFKGSVIVTPKVDGVACSLRYQPDGTLMIAATRGDGKRGEAITQNVWPIESIPHRIPPQGVEIEVRGEIYLPLSRFAGLTDRFSNPRNAAAGTLKRKSEVTAAEVGLAFFAYDLFGVERAHASERLDLSAEWGFTPVPYEVLERQALQSGYERYVLERDQLDYEIDGVVYRAELSSEYERLGATAHHPRGAIAYKLQGDSARTQLIGVDWGVSRNGILTPVGLVEPVKLSGAMVSRITLHHWGMVQAKGLSLGAEVVAMRRGGVIPHLEAVVKPGSETIEAPSQCPQCPHLCAPTRVEGDVLHCDYHGTCEPQAAAILKHWVNVTKIEGFGSVWLDTLTKEKILSDPIDLYRLSAEDVLHLEGVREGRAQRWVESIKTARTLPLATFLCALGIQDLGKTASQALAEHYLTLASVRSATVDDIAGLFNFGQLTAEHITSGLSTRSVLIDGLLDFVSVIDVEARSDLSNDLLPLVGQSFVFTGTLVSMKRTEAQELVRSLGGDTPSGVSAKLSFLVIGDAGKAGSKKTKAEKHGVSILSEAQFSQLISDAQGDLSGGTEADHEEVNEISPSEGEVSSDLSGPDPTDQLPAETEQDTQLDDEKTVQLDLFN